MNLKGQVTINLEDYHFLLDTLQAYKAFHNKFMEGVKEIESDDDLIVLEIDKSVINKLATSHGDYMTDGEVGSYSDPEWFKFIYSPDEVKGVQS